MRPAAANRLQEPKTGETASVAPAAAAKRGFLARKLEAAKESVRARTGAILGMAKKVANYDVGQGAKDLGRKALDVGSMDVGLAARRGLMAAGFAGAMAAPAYAEDKPADAMVVSGAKTELVAGSPDAAPVSIVLAMNDSAPVAGNQGQGQGKDAAEISPDASGKRTTSIFDYVKSGAGAAYGLTGAFPDGYVAYRAQLDAWRKANPAEARDYERRRGEVLSAYVLEGKFAEARYPENVADVWNRGERVPYESAKVRFLDTAGLRAELPAMFTLGLDGEWAKRQAEMENPAALDDDGKYKAEVVLEDTLDTMKRRAKRWDAKLWPKSAEEAKKAQDARLAERAAAAVNALHSLYSKEAGKGNQQEINPSVTVAERTAALSWTAVRLGFGEQNVDRLRLQKDLAELTIAYWARRNQEKVDRIPLLHVGRVMDLSPKGSASASEAPYSKRLLAKMEAALPAELWKETRSWVPAGAEKGDAMHDECTLRVARDDARVPAALRAEIRRALAPSLDIPLVSSQDVMDALVGYSRGYAKDGLAGKAGTPAAMTGEPGSPEYERDRKLVEQLIPAAFAGAVGLPEEISEDRNSMALTKKADAAEKRADESEKSLALIKEMGVLFESYGKEPDAANRLALVRRINEILESERARIEKLPEKDRNEADRKFMTALLPATKAKFAQELAIIAKNG